MNFKEFSDYDDFCKQTGMNGKKAINFLMNELKKLKGADRNGNITER